MYAAPSFTIAFLRSLLEETTAVPHHPERPQCPVMDDSSETIDIMLSPDMSEPHTAMSDSPDSDASPLTRRDPPSLTLWSRPPQEQD
jgi:hypothetical protein